MNDANLENLAVDRSELEQVVNSMTLANFNAGGSHIAVIAGRNEIVAWLAANFKKRTPGGTEG